MTGGKYHISISFLMVLILFLSGCMKVDTLPQLEIQVLDEKGVTVSGAYVGLFNTAEEWNKLANPVQAWRMTGADGKVLFADLDEIAYYVYVRFDGKDNSVGEIYTTDPLRLNQRSKIIVQVR